MLPTANLAYTCLVAADLTEADLFNSNLCYAKLDGACLAGRITEERTLPSPVSAERMFVERTSIVPTSPGLASPTRFLLTQDLLV